MDYNTTAQTIILLGTGCVVGWYTWETHKLRKEAEKTAKLSAEAAIFNTLTTIHEQLMNDQSRSNRYLVINRLSSALADVVSQIIDKNFVDDLGPNRTVSLNRVLKTMQKDGAKASAFLEKFDISQLKGDTAVLTAPESVLDDFNLIAVPYSLGVQAAKEAAQQYKPMLQRTAPPLLTFVAIRRKLTGDPTYRSHYVQLLQKLQIDTLGVA